MAWMHQHGTLHDFPHEDLCAKCSIYTPSFRDSKTINHGWGFHFNRGDTDLVLDSSTGLVIPIISTHTAEIKPHEGDALVDIIREELPDVQGFTFQREFKYNEQADYKGFNTVLKYALSRFRKIASELSRSRRLDSRYVVAEHEVLAAFYQRFCVAVVENELLIESARQNLISRAEPLRRESEHRAEYVNGIRDCRFGSLDESRYKRLTG